MLLPNVDVDAGRLHRLVSEHYDGAGPDLRFVPLGEDSWCYRTGSLWVSVRRDQQGHRPQAYALTHRLRARGLDFVLAPLAGRDGRIVRPIGDRPVVVFPLLPVSQLGARDVTDADVANVLAMLDRVHGLDAAGDLDAERFDLPFLSALDDALRLARDPGWSAGPLSRPLHRSLTAAAAYIEELRAEADRLGRECRADSDPFVVTHGEPSMANVLVHGGDLMLADWGAAAWGPPERDWFHVARTTGRAVPGRAAFLRFYEVRWALGEIAEYAEKLTRPHTGDEDDRAMWQRLGWYLPQATGAVEAAVQLGNGGS